MYMYDPPSGWQHGWPKRFHKALSRQELVLELLNSGYTQVEIDKYVLRHTRMWIHLEPKMLRPSNAETPSDEGYF